MTMGDNSEGQFGLGHKKRNSQLNFVKKVRDKFVTVRCLVTKS